MKNNNFNQYYKRYRIYREHKFIISFINDISRKIATTDFLQNSEIKIIKKEITKLANFIIENTEHEIKAFHFLLEAKKSTIHKEIGIEKDHNSYENIFNQWHTDINKIIKTKDEEYKIFLGYNFYLNFRLFEANNLIHLHKEETILMPKLQELYSDQEIRQLEVRAYQIMKIEELLHMVKTLFPYLDANDRLVYIKDIKKEISENKFIKLFNNIIQIKHNNKTIISNEERINIIKKLKINQNEIYFNNNKDNHKIIDEKKFKYEWQEHNKNDFILKTQYRRNN